MPDELRSEIVPRNILMVGPTGVGKTEIARRLAKLVDAPFIKVEATKFTEVGYRGQDVDSIISDLTEQAVKRQRSKLEAQYSEDAESKVSDTILDALLGQTKESDRPKWMDLLKKGDLDDRMVTVDVPMTPRPAETFQGGMDQGMQMVRMVPSGPGRMEKQKLKVGEAKERLKQAALNQLISAEMVVSTAVEAVEQEGIVFIDEIDKVCQGAGPRFSGDASAEGVQRDLLPIIEGSEVSTKYGPVKTDHILFVCVGAFSSVKPSDMLAELQGRLPVRVSLNALTEADFVRVLTEPKNNIVRQNQALLGTEKIELVVPPETIQEVARVAYEINTYVENIGARRLHTVLEKIMEDISYEAPHKKEDERTVVVTPQMVTEAIAPLMKKMDLSKFIL